MHTWRSRPQSAAGPVGRRSHRRDRAPTPGRARTGVPAALDALHRCFKIASRSILRSTQECPDWQRGRSDPSTRTTAHLGLTLAAGRHEAVVSLPAPSHRLSEEDMTPDAALAIAGDDAQLFVLSRRNRAGLGAGRFNQYVLQQDALR
jgi:hypothetical protein